MIPRYTKARMGAVWSDEQKYRTWLKVELAVCEVMAEMGALPATSLQTILEKADFSVQRIDEIEAEVKHDVIAFLTNVAEHVGPDARYIHQGMTSSDLLDTALSLQIQEAGRILREDVEAYRVVLRDQALAHKNTICVGRSHGIHAEPTSFGLKFALWYDEMGRNLLRLNQALERNAVGMISGAVGNYTQIDPIVEQRVCKKLGLRPAPVSTQVIQRDLHAEFMTDLALTGATLEKIAVEIRHLQRTEVLEAEEPFTPGQKGSSAMPHKRNPIGSENITGLARLLRGNAMAALENVALWHERDISHSSVERIIFPDSCILLDYMLQRQANIIKKLVVYPGNMERNMAMTRGMIFSQPVLLALTKRGMSREDAYKLVQDHAMQCWKDDSNFQTAIQSDAKVRALLNKDEIDACFDATTGLRHVDYIYQQIGIS